MSAAAALVAPVIAMVSWTAVMWAWMYATRIPAIVRAHMRLDRLAPRGEQMATLPPRVRWKADNYNHLMEQPQVFYATALGLALLGDTSTASVVLAWLYVALRVVHSFVQALVNIIPLRFAVFSASALVLFTLAGRAVLRLTA